MKNKNENRLIPLVGFKEKSKKVVKLEVSALRKPPRVEVTTPYFCFLSHPDMTKFSGRPYFWCHCLRNPNILKGDKYLLPESDFVDPMSFPVQSSSIQYDYFYFTVNHRRGSQEYKGSDVFGRCLPLLSAMGLKGVMVVYFGDHRTVPGVDFRKASGMGLKIIGKKLLPVEVAKLMASCRFGLFPNRMDCSPRMIPQTFLCNRPVLLNREIWGGWHYLQHPNMGIHFDQGSLRTACEAVMKMPHTQAETWRQNFGFEKSSRKLATIMKKYRLIDRDVSHVYFREFLDIFEKWEKHGLS